MAGSLGLQAIAATVFSTFILGLFYRSASLYHPQRRAILHLKNQRRKVKDKNKLSIRPAFFDVRTLHSRTVRILLLGSGITSMGLYTPVFLLAHTAHCDGCSDDAILRAHIALGIAWMMGTVCSGSLVVRAHRECRIGRQYLCQMAAIVAGCAQLAVWFYDDAMSGDHYMAFACVYGAACGAWHYALKVYTYERVRARNFARAWSFVQCAQAPAVLVGVPLAAWMCEDGDSGGDPKAGYLLGAVFTVMGAAVLFLVNVHRRSIKRLQMKQLQQQQLLPLHQQQFEQQLQQQQLMLLETDGGLFSGVRSMLKGVGGVGGAGSVNASRRQLFRIGSARDGVVLLKQKSKQVRRLSFSNEPENDAPFPYSTQQTTANVASGGGASGTAGFPGGPGSGGGVAVGYVLIDFA